MCDGWIAFNEKLEFIEWFVAVKVCVVQGECVSVCVRVKKEQYIEYSELRVEFSFEVSITHGEWRRQLKWYK